MNYEYESDAHRNAVRVVKEYIWRKDEEAKKCGCNSCQAEAQDCFNWLFSQWEWKPHKKIIKKDGKDIQIDDSDLEGEFA